MQIYASDDHRQHHALELDAGRLVPSWDRPERADVVHAALSSVGHPFAEPAAVDHELIARVHDARYLDFLATAWDRWVESGAGGEAAIGYCWPARRMPSQTPPTSLHGQLGYYSFAADCSITTGTWPAAVASAALAQNATQHLIDTGEAAFALCRPPGHHASADQFGGYCYINNAAVAAQQLVESGFARVSVLDIDYHHGNGTQDLFYDRSDVAYLSLHGDPKTEFPYFLGYADETGRGAGVGYNHNEPLPAGTGFADWMLALHRCLDKIQAIATDALVVSVGVDTFEGDPISKFTLETADYPTIGARIRDLDLPTVFIFEGGYAVEEIGVNVVGVLKGFEQR